MSLPCVTRILFRVAGRESSVDAPRRLRVVIDGGALVDARRHAGIGRYVAGLTHALSQLKTIDMAVATPRRAPFREAAALRFANSQRSVVATARRRRADLVHVPVPEPAVGWPLARQVVTLHDLVPWTTRSGRLSAQTYYRLQRGRVARCAAVITDSESVRAEALEILGVPADRAHVVPLGVGEAFRPEPSPDDARLRERAGVPDSGYAVWVGSLRAHDPRKSIDTLVQAVASVAPPVRLVLVGDRGAESRRVADLAASLGVSATVTGYVDDNTLAALYRGAGAAAVTSIHEGFGLPALEALACGTPLVATRGGNLPTLVGDAAVLVNAGKPAELAVALNRVLDARELANRLRHAGPLVASRYRWATVAEMTAAVYRAAVNGGVSS